MKTDYKRTTTVLSVMFVLVGMMFLVPAMTEKALATIEAAAECVESCSGSFSNISGHMSAGMFLLPPMFRPFEKDIIWITKGPGFYGNERGYVVANVGIFHGKVTFYFNNPARGDNTCEAVPDFVARCTITQGVHATASYIVFRDPSRLLQPDANGGDTHSGDEGDNSGDTS